MRPAPSGKPGEGSKLIVGPEVKLKGVEISDCDTLVVEGRVVQVLYHGAVNRVELVTGEGSRLLAAIPAAAAPAPELGASVRAVFGRAALHLMEPA